MNPGRAKEAGLWLAYLAFDTGSQLAFKWAAEATGNSPIGSDWLRRMLAAPGLWIGALCYIATLIVWLNILEGAPLSRAFPMSGLAYVTVPLLAVILFGETLTLVEAAGIAAICGGVAMLATEPTQTVTLRSLSRHPEQLP